MNRRSSGIDISDSVSIAERRSRQLPNVTILQADILRPCFATASFDFVWCEGVVIHTPNPSKALEAIGRLVKPGGQLYVWVYPSDNVSVYQRVRDLLVAPDRLPRPILIMLCYSLANRHAAFVPDQRTQAVHRDYCLQPV